MNCYEYEIIHTSENPILKNVDVSIIMSMKGSNRFIRDPFILNLSKTTIIQWNAGFKKCKKHASVTKAMFDLNHANGAAFSYSKNYNNVIIFEDDATVINKDIDIYKKIDKFIGDENFYKNETILSFGSIGRFFTHNNDFIRIKSCLIPFANSQAIIYSDRARNKLLEVTNKSYTSGQYDYDYVGKNIEHIFTYKYPLIVQTFPESDNYNNWYPNAHPIIATIFRFLTMGYYKLLNLHIKTDGWHFMYFINNDIGALLIYLIILLILLLFYNN